MWCKTVKSFWKHFFLSNGDITLIEAGRQNYVPQQMNSYNVKHDLVFHIVNEGQGVYTVNNKTYPLKANDGFVLKKGNHVFYTSSETDPWTISWIGIGGKNLNNYVQDTIVPSTDVVRFEKDSIVLKEMKSLVDFLSENDPTHHRDYLQLFSQLYKLLYAINYEFPLARLHNHSQNLTESTLADIIYEYIYENFLRNISINAIAEHFDISRNHLFKVCKNRFGESPKQMIQELRMNQAAQLLSGSQMPIKEIANFIGYKDPFSFSKMFKGHFNYSPSEFRKLDNTEYEEVLFSRIQILEQRTLK